ncbi:MAG: aldo/keto reductase [Brasilonema sp.]
MLETWKASHKIGEIHGRTPAQVALNWLIAQGNIIPIAGAKTAEQVRQNAGALGWRLSDDEIRQLEQVSRSYSVGAESPGGF